MSNAVFVSPYDDWDLNNEAKLYNKGLQNHLENEADSSYGNNED